jgi:glycerophosphoryl diester phosphodiesterase
LIALARVATMGRRMLRPLVPILCCALALPAAASAFDIQAHRGGAGPAAESTLAAFEHALRTGVTTLELDVRLTEDGRPLVTHDRRIPARACRDTAPAAPGDPEFPYVGDLVRELSAAQVGTVRCGSERMAYLREVLALARCSAVRFAVDPKYAAAAPGETAPRRQIAGAVLRAVRAARVARRVTIQSFDWRMLRRLRGLTVVAAWSDRFLEAGRPGASPWLGGLDIDDFGGDAVAAAASLGVDGVAPDERLTTRRLVRRAHRAGMTVVPWTVNDRARMGELIDAGADGLISDRPGRLRAALATPARPCGGRPGIATW